MTYLTTRPQRRLARRYPRTAMGGGFLDFIRDAVEQKELDESAGCKAQADAETAGMTARRLDLSSNWHPTGFYSPDQMKEIIEATFNVINKAYELVETSRADLPGTDYTGDEYGYTHTLELKRAELLRQTSESTPFNNAIIEARSKGIEVIDTPGLRRWVLSAMRSAESATLAVSYVNCMKPWWLAVLRVIAQVMEVLWAICKAIGGLVKKVGELVLEVPDTLGKIYTVAKWTAILGLPLFVFYKIYEQRQRGGG